MSKLWEKQNIGQSELASWIETFTVGNDYQMDQVLIPYDIKASIAHAKGLKKIGLLTGNELDQLANGLNEIQELAEKGEFQITKQQEDCHTAIEDYLTAHVGEAGKKIHTGRSRNDQVLTAMRLYEKEQLNKVIDAVLELAECHLELANTYEFVPMAGYTHMQPAMVSSVGMWSGSYAEMLISSANFLRSIQEMIDYCPLGTAAGFGVNLPLDREFVSKELGFKAPITIAMTAQSTRGKWESSIVHGLTTVSGTLAQFASDLILYTSAEYALFKLPDELTTGSSIMPQKKNLDVAELVRAKHHEIVSNEFLLLQLSSKLTTGYHRDFQLTKEPVVKSFTSLLDMIKATSLMVKHLTVDETKLQGKIYPELFAADRANELVKEGIPFRDAYKLVASSLESLETEDPKQVLESRTHLGATGNLGLEILTKNLNHASLYSWMKQYSPSKPMETY